jgi:hypothetical protein
MPSIIQDEPYRVSPVNQKLIFVLYDSAHNGESGFKYYLKVSKFSIADVIYEGIFDQNANGYGVIDLRPILAPLVTTPNSSIDSTNVHTSAEANRDLFQMWDISVTTGWNIDGVFTLNAGDIETRVYAFWDGEFFTAQGYKPNPEDIFRINHLDNANPKRILTQRFPNVSNRYPIPTATANDIVNKCGSHDWGVLSFIPYQDTITDGVDIFHTNNRVMGMRIKAYDESHTLLASVDISSLFVSCDPSIQHMMAYPQNLENYGVTLSGWKYYSIQFLEQNLAEPERPYVVNPKHWFYREECETRFEKVRLGWINSDGGWDYFNFTKKNELTTEVERKRIKNIQGDYSTTGGVFTMDIGLGEMQEITVDSKLYLDINSNWIDEYDFQYLSSLIRSKRVHIVKSDGTFIPVLVENNSWVHQRIRSARLSKATIKLQLANGWQQM